MKQRPILFSTPMVQAILEGTKSMTRRVLKDKVPMGNWEETVKHCPFGNIGDVLWVREVITNDAPIDEPPIWVYKADGSNYPLNSGQRWKPSIHMPKDACRLFLRITNVRVERLQDISEEDAKAEGINWNPPYRASVYPQGMTYFEGSAWIDLNGYTKCTCTAKESFETLWNSINGEDSWNANPWVWVIEFERIDKPSYL